MRNVIMDAIKKMYDADEKDCIRLPTGTVVRSWALIDDGGQAVPLSTLTDDQVFDAYLESVKWGEPANA